MNILQKTKFKNIFNLLTLLLVVVLVFPGATIDTDVSPDAIIGEDAGGGGAGTTSENETSYCASKPANPTNTLNDINVLAIHNGQNTNDNSHGQNGVSENATITVQYGDQIQIDISGTAGPGAAQGAVQGIVTMGGNVVFNETTTGSGGVEATASYEYDIPSITEFTEVRVISTACNNVTTTILEVYVGAEPNFKLNCGLNKSVARGEIADYALLASNFSNIDINQSIHTTLSTSDPDGVTMDPTPVDLTPNNGYSGTAYIPTQDLSPQSYTLTFSADAAANNTIRTCQANLTVTGVTPTVDLKFDGHDGPTTPTPSDGDKGELSWDTTDAISCEADMVQGTFDAWKGEQNIANEKTETFTVGGLQVDNTYEFKITCLSSSGVSAEDSVIVRVGEPQAPTGDFYCEGDIESNPDKGSCSITSGTSAVLFWDTAYTESCVLGPVIKDYTPGTSEKKGVLTGTLSNPPDSSKIYTLTCQGINGFGKYESQVTVNIEPASPTVTIGCSPSTLSLSAGGAPGTITVTVDIENPGEIDQVDITPSFPFTDFLEPPTFSYADNPLGIPNPGVASVIVSTTLTTDKGASLLDLNISHQNVPLGSCRVTLVITGQQPQPPVNVLAAVPGCGEAIVTWDRPNSGPSPDSYQVYTSISELGTTFLPIGDPVSAGGILTSDTSYSFTDNEPVFDAQNFYAVKSLLNGVESDLSDVSNPVVPEACEASMAGSDKDLYQVGNNLADPPECNNKSDSFTPAGQLSASQEVFREGSRAYFKINICNSGYETLTGLEVSDVGFNLTDIQLEEELSDDCVVGEVDTQLYALDDFPPKTSPSDPTPLCTIVVSGILTAENQKTGGAYLYRFWNQAIVYSQQLDPMTITTQPYLFSKNGTVPTRGENN